MSYSVMSELPLFTMNSRSRSGSTQPALVLQTMLHIDRGGDNETSRWWVGEALERGLQFDILEPFTATHPYGKTTSTI